MLLFSTGNVQTMSQQTQTSRYTLARNIITMKWTVFLLIIILILIYFLNKKMNHDYEIKRIEKFGKQNHKKIKAQAEYRKASKNEKSSDFRFLNQISKMFFILF